jgi:hypothetical protein
VHLRGLAIHSYIRLEGTKMTLTPKQMWASFWRIMILMAMVSTLAHFAPKWGFTIGWLTGWFASMWYDAIIERFKAKSASKEPT